MGLTNIVEKKYYGRVPTDRLIAGELIVIARNLQTTSPGVDCNFVYNQNWDGTGTLERETEQPYNNNQPSDVHPDDSGGYDDWNWQIMDYDVLIFDLIVCGHLEAARNHGSVNGNGYYTQTPDHYGCISGIRHRLRTRANNAYSNANFYKWYHQNTLHGYRNSAVTNDTAAIAEISDRIFNNTKWDAPDSDGYGFPGLNLGPGNTNAKFFNPIHVVEITMHHPIEVDNTGPAPYFYKVTNHDTSYYELLVNIKLWGYDPAGGASYETRFRTVTQVMFKPFGETGKISFAESSTFGY